MKKISELLGIDTCPPPATYSTKPFKYQYAPHMLIGENAISINQKLYNELSSMGKLSLVLTSEDEFAKYWVSGAADIPLIGVNYYKCGYLRYLLDISDDAVNVIIADIRHRYKIPEHVASFALIAKTSQKDTNGYIELTYKGHNISFK